MKKKLTERIEEELKNVDETSPIAQCYNFILEKLNNFPKIPYNSLVKEAVEIIGKKHSYCDPTRNLLIETLTEFNDNLKNNSLF